MCGWHVLRALSEHGSEYAIEGALLGMFMISACVFGVVLEHPTSVVRRHVASAAIRRAIMGLAMGLTAIALIYSSWGKRSGAHMNPAVTLTFWWLGKVHDIDAVMYIIAQCVGGVGGVLVSRLLLGRMLAHGNVNHVATVPGRKGVLGLWVAWAVELAISFMLLSGVLHWSNDGQLMPYAGLLAGAMVGLFIFVTAPLSGMSMNPARSLGSAAFARTWRPLWVYFTAPPTGMMLAAVMFTQATVGQSVKCAKLCHLGHERCIFKDCGWAKRDVSP